MIFERPPAGERVLCVMPEGIACPFDAFELEEQGRELGELVDSLDLVTLEVIHLKVRQIRRGTYLGPGQIERISMRRKALGADLIAISIELSATQQRNLEKVLACKVLTRTEVILMVFSERARSFEGKLQVELAELQHSATRIVSGWTHLDRQKGGIGLRGAGETQAEADRRQIAARIRKVQGAIANVARRRASGRRKRVRAGVATVALVGYTNSGKSTLFNRLTGAAVATRDRAFETLDPTLRRIELPEREDAVLIDTVGFVRELPESLVAAFQATLEEATEADLLLLVTDASAPDRLQRRESVLKVLTSIGAAHLPRIEVINKIDLLAEQRRTPDVDERTKGTGTSTTPKGQAPKSLECPVSALTGTGTNMLKQCIAYMLGTGEVHELAIAPNAGGVRARLYALGAVLGDSSDADGTMRLTVRLSSEWLQSLLKEDGVTLAAKS
ncbi:MAG: GTPase HflX [Gammaproteobacteria bacterium]|nr:GTPase HflX [Gammaproteobacteria bacterium]